jgi:hypothetical protein
VKKEVLTMINQFNLTDEILEAAKLLKEEQDLIGSPEAIALIIFHWLCEQLEEIEWNYQNSRKVEEADF